MKKLLFCVVVLALAACVQPRNNAFSLPEKVGDYVLQEQVTGQEALLEINALHGKSIKAQNGIIGKYAGPGKSLQLWISRAASPDVARKQTGEMVHSMFENPKSPFSWGKRMDYKGVAVYPFTGMGQVHLIFFKNDLVYWVSVNPGMEKQALEAVLGD